MCNRRYSQILTADKDKQNSILFYILIIDDEYKNIDVLITLLLITSIPIKLIFYKILTAVRAFDNKVLKKKKN